jgi:hypothetical protein
MKKLRCKNWEKYQNYPTSNKNYSIQQPWFMMYGRTLINERRYMSLTSEQRDFLVTGCWCIGSQESGFLPAPEDIAFKLRVDIEKVNAHLKTMLELDWLEEYQQEDYEEIMNDLNAQVDENKRKKKNQPRDTNDLKKEAGRLGFGHLTHSS